MFAIEYRYNKKGKRKKEKGKRKKEKGKRKKEKGKRKKRKKEKKEKKEKRIEKRKKRRLCLIKKIRMLTWAQIHAWSAKFNLPPPGTEIRKPEIYRTGICHVKKNTKMHDQSNAWNEYFFHLPWQPLYDCVVRYGHWVSVMIFQRNWCGRWASTPDVYALNPIAPQMELTRHRMTGRWMCPV